ncbi:MAG: cyclic peptide export ABC transporter [Chloroflexi bacterium]|nr:cyclic peptide export ABC transporter [Chloroflexota bacterium]
MKLFRLALRAFQTNFLVTLCVGLLSGIGNAALVALISRQLTQHKTVTMHFVALFAGLILVVLGLDLLAKWLLIRLTGWTAYNLRMNLARQILTMPFAQLETLGAPRLLAMLTEDVMSITQALNSLPTLCIAGATLAGCIFYLAWLSPWLVLIMGLLATPVIFGHLLLQRKAHFYAKHVLRERNRVFNLYRALTEGAKELKLNAARRHAFFSQLLQPISAEVQQKGITSRTWHQIAQTWSQSGYFIFILGVFVWAGWQQMSVTMMTSYALVVLFMRSSVNSILSTLPFWTDASVAINQMEIEGFILSVDQIISDLPTPVSPTPVSPTPVSSTRPQYQLSLTQVTYQYSHESEERTFLLGPLDLQISSGELIFLTGGNGSGKTTLAKLLAGLYSPQTGAIFLNGEQISDNNREAYRQNFSAVFADFHLFEQFLGLDPQKMDQQAQAYLMRLQLEHKVKIVGNQLSTLDLSHGQRKRLALLTAYLEDRPIYIFDEWAASQDPEFRDVFYRQLLPELRRRGKLVIVISHDDHYFDVADRLIKLDFGQIDEGQVKQVKIMDAYTSLAVPA